MENDFLAYLVMKNDLGDFKFEKKIFIKNLHDELRKGNVRYISMDCEESPYPHLNILLSGELGHSKETFSEEEAIKSSLAKMGIENVSVDYRGNLYKDWDCYKNSVKR